MIVNVWLLQKNGADRIYTTTVCPTAEQLSAWKRDGFSVFRASIHLPIYDEVEIPVVHGAALTEEEIFTTRLAPPVKSEDGQGAG